MANSASRVQLAAPNGQVLSDVSYEESEAGAAWAWDGLVWKWTTKPSPNHVNVFIAPLNGAQIKKSTKITKKKSTAKKSTKKTNVKGDSTVDLAKADQTQIQQKPKLHTSVVAGVGGLAVLYGAYEYRQDMANAFHKFRRNRKDRPEAGHPI